MDLFKFLFTRVPIWAACASTGKQAVGLRLKGFLLDVIISGSIEAKTLLSFTLNAIAQTSGLFTRTELRPEFGDACCPFTLLQQAYTMCLSFVTQEGNINGVQANMETALQDKRIDAQALSGIFTHTQWRHWQNWLRTVVSWRLNLKHFS